MTSLNPHFLTILAALALWTPVAAGAPLSVQMPERVLHLTASRPLVLNVRNSATQQLTARVLRKDNGTVLELKAQGQGAFAWDGRDRLGRRVKPGTYIVEVTEDGYLWSTAVSVLP